MSALIKPASTQSSTNAMTSAKRSMLIRYPFFGTIALNMEWVKVRDDDPLIRTAATDGYRIFWNGSFIEKLDMNGRVFVAAHEIGHVVVMTLSRLGKRNLLLWNIASDYALNAMLKEFGLTIPSMRIEGEQKEVGLYDPQYNGMTSEEIYEKLQDEILEKIVTMDQHFHGKKLVIDQDGFVRPADATENEIKAQRRKMKSVINQAAAGASNVPASVRKMILELNDPIIDWKSVINMKLLSKKRSDYEWVPPDSGTFYTGMTLPQLTTAPHLRASIVLDASGSMSDDDHRNIFSEIKSIAEEFTSWEMQILSFDSEAYNPTVFTSESPDDILKYNVVGGGGTCFRPPLEVVMQSEFKEEPVLFFTDGFSSDGWCNDLSMLDLLWVINSSATPTWGEMVRYDRHI